MESIRDAIGGFSSEKRGALMAKMFLGILFSVFTVRESCADTLSLTSSASYQQAINVTYSNPTAVGNALQVTIQIQNTSGTWVYIEQDTTSTPNIPVSLPYTVYLLGPGGTKTLDNVAFTVNSYLKFNVTTPIGLDFTTLATDPKPRALFGAMIVDCTTRGLLTFALPANAFDEPFNGATGVVDPLLDNIVSTLQQNGSSIGSAAVDLKNRDWVKLSVDFGQIASQIASESSSLKNSISQLLQRANIGLSSGQVGTFFGNASTWLGVIAEVLDLPAKYTLLHDISISTFGAPPSSWNRFDIVVTAQAPSVSYISPSTFTGLPIAQRKPIRIIGSGFTSSSTLVFNDSTQNYNSNPAYLTFISANEIDYNISTGTNQANWTVQVVNGAQTSTLGHFTVNAPTVSPPATGSLVVNLSPAGAVSAGAQWQVDGTGYNSDGQVVGYLTPGSHTVSFKPISGYTTPGNQTVTINANAQTTTGGTYSVITPNTYTLTINYNPTQGLASPSPLVPQTSSTYGSYSFGYTANAVTLVQASASTGYHFTGWSGDASGAANPITVTMNGNKNITANFASGDPNMGTVIVKMQPPEAVVAGVKWGWNVDDYRDSGTSVTTWPATYILTIHSVDGWLGPSALWATVTAGQITNYTVTFTQDTTPGLLTVTLSPPDAVTAGAKWHVNGGVAQGNGSTVSLPPGSGYIVTFDFVTGWTAPPSQTVAIQRAQTRVVTGNYTPPAGQPVIAAIHPSFGALLGGTALTIEGVNFTAPATVLLGGRPATNVSVLSASQIVCFTPSNSAYGSVPVVVQTAGGNATNLNGFTYGIERGNGIEMVTAIGGRAYGVAVQSNYAYVGEGSSLLVLNISNPANSSLVGRLPLPGKLMDIALFGQYAYVADADAGLQVVDISKPENPVLKGYYPSSGWANGIAILGGHAYLAGGAGLEILDLANPIVPALLSSTNFNGNADAIAVVAKSNGVFAYLSSGGYLAIVDVSQPLSPVLRGSTYAGGWAQSLAVSGDYVFVASIVGNLRTVNVSNPDAPVDLGQTSINLPGISGIVTANSVSAANGIIYAGSYYLYVLSQGGGLPTPQAWSRDIGSDGYHSVISGNRLYLAGGSKGFQAVDVSNPSGPSLLAKFTDSDSFGDYFLVATLSGNHLFTMGYAGFKVFDVSNPVLPIQLWQNAALNGGYDGQIILKNGYAFIATGNSPAGTSIVNVNNPASPSLLANYIARETVYPIRMSLSGDNLLIAGNDNSNVGKLVAFDVSSPSSPVQRGSLSFTAQTDFDPAISVAVVGATAVVGMQSGALKIIDVSNINQLVERGQITNIGSPRDIVLTADAHYAYVIDGNVGRLRIIDVSNSLSVSVVTNIPLGTAVGVGMRLAMQGNILYAVAFQNVFVFDVTKPTSPVLVRSYPFSGATGIALDPNVLSQRDMLYLASSDNGFAVLKNKDIETPTIFVTNPTFSSIYTNTSGTINLGGGADDNVGVTRITWSNNRGSGGEVSSPFDNWFVSGIMLLPGTNVLTVTAFDQAGNSGSDTLTVIYQSAKQNQTITFPALANRTFGDAPVPLAAAASSGLLVNFSVVSGPACLSNNVLSLLGTGAVTVQASQPGNDFFNPAPPTNVSFPVAKADQAIAFTSLPDKSAGDPAFALSATTSSGLPLYFDIVSGPAVLDTNMVTLLGGGMVTVSAWQPGNSNYNAAATVQRSFNVAKLVQTISFGPLSRQTVGDAPFPLSASASSGLLVDFAVVSGPAMLSGNIVTLTGWGTVAVRASQAGNATFAAAANVDQSFDVAPPNYMLANPQRLADGSFQMVLYGVTGNNYTLLASTNLANWEPIASFIATNSLTPLRDPVATNFNQRFYRIVAP